MSNILNQLKQYQDAARISAEWNDLVSVEEVAEKTKKSIKQVKEVMKEKNIQPKGKFGKSYLYSKAEILEKILL